MKKPMILPWGALARPFFLFSGDPAASSVRVMAKLLNCCDQPQPTNQLG